MVIRLEQSADLHIAQLMPLPLTVSCFSKIQIGFTFLVPAHPCSSGIRAFERMRVCSAVAGYIWYNPTINLLHVILNQICLKSPYNLSCTYWTGVCLQCFDAVGWAAGRASGL